jgi:hypothetical protein
MPETKPSPSNQLSVLEKIALLRPLVETAERDKQGHNYRYVTDTEILLRISDKMNEIGLMLIPKLISESVVVTPLTLRQTKTTSNGVPYEKIDNTYIVTSQITYIWQNIQNRADTLEIPWTVVGQMENASQALGSGLSYSMRYFLLKFFNIATPEDADAYESKKRDIEEAQEKALTQEIISQITEFSKSHIGEPNSDGNAERREEIAAFVTSVIGNANYGKIKESLVAGNLLSKLREKFTPAEDISSEVE